MAIALTGTTTHTKTLVNPTSGTLDKVYGADYVSASSHTTTVSITGLTANALLLSDGTDLTQSAGLLWGPTAGLGLQIAAGTATTDVAALSITRTNNNAAVATGVKIVYTDTLSAAGFLPFQVLGTSTGAANLMSLSKGGVISVPVGSISAPSYSFSGISANHGMWSSGSSNVDFSAAGVNALRIATDFVNFNGSTPIRLWQTGFSSPVVICAVASGVVGIGAAAAGFDGSLKLTNTQNVGYQELDEMTAPAGAANSARVFTQDNGAGKTQLMVIFGSGAAIQLAIEA